MIHIRTVKKHDVRKQELISIAEKLFLSNGYEQTTVNTIIEQAGVAKGTFYHYFKSKEDVLDEMVGGYIENIADLIDTIYENSGIDTLQKIEEAIDVIFKSIQGKEDLFGSLHEDNNIILHHKVERKMYQMVSPKLYNVLTEGIQTGIFKIKFPREAAEYLYVVMGHLFDLAAMRERPNDFEGMIFTAGHIIEGLLGIKKGSLVLNLSEYLNS